MQKRASLLQEGLEASVCTYTLTCTVIQPLACFTHTADPLLCLGDEEVLALKPEHTAGCRLPGKARRVPPSRQKHTLPSQRLFVGFVSSPAPWLSAAPCAGACSQGRHCIKEGQSHGKKERRRQHPGENITSLCSRSFHPPPSIFSSSSQDHCLSTHTLPPPSLSLPSFSASSHSLIGLQKN